jgi:hypothetical protein
MSTQTIIVTIAIVMILVIAVGGLRRGPRITQITRTVDKDDERKDGPDA